MFSRFETKDLSWRIDYITCILVPFRCTFLWGNTSTRFDTKDSSWRIDYIILVPLGYLHMRGSVHTFWCKRLEFAHRLHYISSPQVYLPTREVGGIPVVRGGRGEVSHQLEVLSNILLVPMESSALCEDCVCRQNRSFILKLSFAIFLISCPWSYVCVCVGRCKHSRGFLVL